jgi:hypothetical protein
MARSDPNAIPRDAKRRVSRAGVTSTSSTRGGWGARWKIATDRAPSCDAVALVDHISDVVMAEHHGAITEGERADGSGKQPPLASWGQAGIDAAQGKRPNIRGVTASTTKPFADNIERTAIKVKGSSFSRSRPKQVGLFQRIRVNETVEATKASTTIRPDQIHESFMGLEYEKRGNAFFFVGGKVAEAVDKALAAFTGLALEGVVAKGRKREIKAINARTRKGKGKVYGG